MRHIAVVFTLVAALAVPSAASAGTVTMTDYTTGHFANNAAGGGGPFLATPNGGPLGNTPFIAFCLEIIEHISYNTAYNYSLSDGATNGGAGGQTLPNYDPLSDETKWLYYQVISGQYEDWYETVTGLTLGSGVGANFQYAFWHLENEQTYGPSTAPYKMVAWAMAQGDLSTPGYNVVAMNLTNAAGAPLQSQLAAQPVPEPGSLVLLGTGLLLAARRFARKRNN